MEVLKITDKATFLMTKKLAICIALLLFVFCIIGNSIAFAGEVDRENYKPIMERWIWNRLKEAFDGNEVAAAAIIGNLMYESDLCPYRYEGLTYEESKKLNAINRDDECKFVYSIMGYGLAGWTYSHNLQKLWDFCEVNEYKVDDYKAQIEFLIDDIQKYPRCYKRLMNYKTEDLVTACEDFRQSYEKSSNEYRVQWCRATFAKTVYIKHCESKSDIKIVENLPMDFEITEKAKAMDAMLKDTVSKYESGY